MVSVLTWGGFSTSLPPRPIQAGSSPSSIYLPTLYTGPKLVCTFKKLSGKANNTGYYTYVYYILILYAILLAIYTLLYYAII